MLAFSTQSILLLMSLILFLVGLGTMITGVVILATRASSKEMRTLAAQTTKLAQKGIAEDVAGLVGNASTLLEALNQLVRTTTGIGVFLTVLGLLMSIASVWLALQSL
jgi:hypothetical protein